MMARSFADLEARVRGMASRVQRNEDMTAIGTTVLGTREDVLDLRVDVQDLKLDVHDLKVDVHWLKRDVDGLKVDVSELTGRMAWLKRAVQALMTHQGVAVEPDDTAE